MSSRTSVPAFDENESSTSCGEYVDPNGHCQFCDASCSKCTGPSSKDCIRCVSTRILNDGLCVLQCPTGKFEFNNQCHLCHHTCKECNGSEPNKCTACETGKKGNKLFLYLGECRQSCPLGYYHSEDGVCEPCFEHCEVCLGQTECKRCFKGYYLANNSCQKNMWCRPGEEEDPDSAECVPCAEGCQTCSLDDPGICTSCIHNYYMYKQQCYRSCPQNTYSDENSLLCIECHPHCGSCDQYECYWCTEGFFLLDGKCVSDCGAGFYSDEITAECEPCHRTCTTCEGFNYNDCTSCKGHLELLHGKCVNPRTKQVDGKFWNERKKLHISSGLGSADLKGRLFLSIHSQSSQSAQNDLLNVLSVPQAQAKRAAREAFSVAAPQLWKPLPLDVRQSQSLSIIRKRSTSTQFQPCDPSCKTCDKTPKTCTSCSLGRFLFGESCIHTCPQGTFGNMKMRKCEDCTGGCEECIRTNHCLKCRSDLDAPHYLYQGKCFPECPEGFFAEDGICTMCSPPCKTCKGDATTCHSCESPLFLEQGECKPACSEKHFAVDGICKECPEMCQECFHENTCKVCEPPYLLHNESCFRHCPPRFFDDTIRCFPCYGHCEECDGPDSDDCTECLDDAFVLSNGECLDECPEGTYYEAKDKACQDCDETCQTCSSSTVCTTCREGLMMTPPGHCEMQCALTEYYDEYAKTCRKCHRKCLSCTGFAEDQCLSCPRNWILLNTICVEACPHGYYMDRDEHQCHPCHENCETCNGRHSRQCLSCHPGWYRQEHGCVPSCSTGYYANNVTGSCEKCHKSCNECAGPEPTDCLSCGAYLFLLPSKNECLLSCPEHYFADHVKNTCERCHPTCSSCNGKGALSCTSCVWSYRLSGGICYSECFAGEYKVSEEDPLRCEKCHENCTECKGLGPFNCTVCPPDAELYLDESRCVPCCVSYGPEESQECCDCSEIRGECILRTSMKLPTENKGKAAALVIASSILLILTTGAIIFIWRRSRGKPKPPNQARYEKLTDNAKTLTSFKSNHYQSSSYPEDQVIEYKDRDDDDDDDDDDDIVYMGQDGTVYRKFKYGLLEDDGEDELEYDDESYSFR